MPKKLSQLNPEEYVALLAEENELLRAEAAKDVETMIAELNEAIKREEAQLLEKRIAMIVGDCIERARKAINQRTMN